MPVPGFLNPIRPFLITGTGRCGTYALGASLRELGFLCQHEHVFTAWVDESLAHAAFRYIRCEASPYAVPYLADLPEDTLIIHAVRHPLAVIRAFAGTTMFGPQSDPDDPYSAFLHAHHGIDRAAPMLESLMAHWIDWNRRIESSPHELLRVQIESFNPQDLIRMMQRVMPDLDVSARQFEQAWAVAGQARNPKQRDESIALADLMQLPRYEELAQLGREYGYTDL